jgi:ammonia channel protein AmtB
VPRCSLRAPASSEEFTFLTSLAAWFAIKRTMGLRVSVEHERAGLDLSEMGMEAYPSDAFGDAAADATRLPPIGMIE